MKRNIKHALLATQLGRSRTTSSLHDTQSKGPNFDTPLLSDAVSIVAKVRPIGLPGIADSPAKFNLG
jgi:hypothetical protein